jgi:hypothetical protein
MIIGVLRISKPVKPFAWSAANVVIKTDHYFATVGIS